MPTGVIVIKTDKIVEEMAEILVIVVEIVPEDLTSVGVLVTKKDPSLNLYDIILSFTLLIWIIFRNEFNLSIDFITN